MAQLNADTIAATALTLLDAGGLRAFSLRGVARALEVTPMALYHYVRDKAALANLVVARATDEHPLPPRHDEWREDLWFMARNTRESTLSHPALFDLRRDYAVWTPGIIAMADRWMSNWRASGLSAEKAVLAATASSAAISGLVAAESQHHGQYRPPVHVDTLAAPNAELLLYSVSDAEAVFELSVRSIIDGLHSRLSQ